MNIFVQRLKYILSDTIAATLALWFFFNGHLKGWSYPWNFSPGELLLGKTVYSVPLLFLVAWFALYLFVGYYRKPYRKSKMGDFTQTFSVSCVGGIVLLLTVWRFCVMNDNRYYLTAFAFYIFVHFLFTFLGRYIITSQMNKRIHNREIGFPTIIIGHQETAQKLIHEIENEKKSSGNLLIGFVSLTDKHADLSLQPSTLNPQPLPYLGSFEEIESIIKKHNIEETLVATEANEIPSYIEIVSKLLALGVTVRISPETEMISYTSVHTTSIYGTPLIEFTNELQPYWQQLIKRFFDILFALIFGILMSPIFVIAAIGVRRSSKGKILYKQERIGLHGKSFTIYKFRSMKSDAETSVPMLSNVSDNRVTIFGRFMRKYRIDEFPQVYNVLKGEMSWVGLRPERAYFIEQIVKKSPEYLLLLRVKPGITSWGEVKYGYAENVDQMVERMKYDLLYMSNISLAVDLKILTYTILTVLKGEGK